MANIQFSIGDYNYALYKQAKSNFKSKVTPALSDAEIIEVFSKMLAIEEADDAETERDLKEEIGWYDEDCDEPDSTFQKFLEEDDEKEEEVKPKRKKRK
jgi:hypothetical protein